MSYGTKLKYMQLHYGIWSLSMRPSKYVKETVTIIEEYDVKYLSKGYRLPKVAENPFSISYCPKLDVPLVLEPDEASCYLS